MYKNAVALRKNAPCEWTLRSIHMVRFALHVTAVLYMSFCKIVHMVRWVWMQFVMYLHWNHTLKLHRIGMEPIYVQHHTQKCITRRANHTMWTVSLTSTQSNFCILKIAVAHRTVWTSLYTESQGEMCFGEVGNKIRLASIYKLGLSSAWEILNPPLRRKLRNNKVAHPGFQRRGGGGGLGGKEGRVITAPFSICQHILVLEKCMAKYKGNLRTDWTSAC